MLSVVDPVSPAQLGVTFFVTIGAALVSNSLSSPSLNIGAGSSSEVLGFTSGGAAGAATACLILLRSGEDAPSKRPSSSSSIPSNIPASFFRVGCFFLYGDEQNKSVRIALPSGRPDGLSGINTHYVVFWVFGQGQRSRLLAHNMEHYDRFVHSSTNLRLLWLFSIFAWQTTSLSSAKIKERVLIALNSQPHPLLSRCKPSVKCPYYHSFFESNLSGYCESR